MAAQGETLTFCTNYGQGKWTHPACSWGLGLEIARLQNVDLRRAMDKTGKFLGVVLARMDLFGNCVRYCYKLKACLTC